jgi:organizing structure protein 2
LPADESLTPGGIYVLISGLTGSVLTRTRSLPIRWLAPPLFALASAPYFLPKTSSNIRAYLSRVENAHFPELAAEHDKLNAQVSSTWNRLQGQVGGAGEAAKGWGERAARGVEDATGLKVANVRGEVLRRVDEAKAQAKAIRDQGLPKEGERLERVGVIVEQRPVAEIVAPVGAAAGAAEAAKDKPKTRLV